MRAVILTGGQGRRLYPYTLVIPKPLVPLGETPILEIVIRQLKRSGFERVTLAVGRHAELIMAVMGDGEKWGLHVDYSQESEPLGTIAPLRLVADLDQPFLVMNGDLLTDIDYRELVDYHRREGCVATVAVCKQHVQLSLGVMTYGEDRRATGFQEKPAYDFDVSMGVYVFEPGVLEYIPSEGPFGFDQLMLSLLDAGTPIAIYPFAGRWLDMGTQIGRAHV